MLWYPQLIEYAHERIGVPPEEFVGLRFEMSYPPFPTSLNLQWLAEPRTELSGEGAAL